MQPDINHGLMVSFEGIDGCGKTTQINLFKEGLIELGYKPLILREPGGTNFGEALRSTILNSEEHISPLAEALLFASSRVQLLEEKAIPFLKEDPKKNIVILDRYIHSSFAYQGVARSLGFDTISKIHSNYPLNILPHLTFYLSISVKTSLKRQKNRNEGPDYFEKEKKSFYNQLVEGYEHCTEYFSKSFTKINGEQNPELISQTINNHFVTLVKNRGKVK